MAAKKKQSKPLKSAIKSPFVRAAIEQLVKIALAEGYTVENLEHELARLRLEEDVQVRRR